MTHIPEKAALCPAGSCSNTRAQPQPEQNSQLLRSPHGVRKTYHTKRAPLRPHLCNFTTVSFQFMVGFVTSFCPHTDMLPLQPLFPFPTAPVASCAALRGVCERTPRPLTSTAQPVTFQTPPPDPQRCAPPSQHRAPAQHLNPSTENSGEKHLRGCPQNWISGKVSPRGWSSTGTASPGKW